MHAVDLRRRVRSGLHRGLTTGHAPGYAQGNLLVLPADYAEEFAAFCAANPRACPLMGTSLPGNHGIPALGADLDIRSDLPRYWVYRHGVFNGEVENLTELWRDDFVAFVLGCWFTVEDALKLASVRLRHIELGIQGPMFRTNVATVPAGRFQGPMVMSMRPFAPADAIQAVLITSGFPLAHGAPLHMGDPAMLGIRDLARPDFGEPIDVQPGEIPLYWGCGVTSQVAMMAAKPPIAITHAPGCMLVTDIPSASLSSARGMLQ